MTKTKKASKQFFVDIDVWNCNIRAAKPRLQKFPMPLDDVGKMLFMQNPNLPMERLNDRIWGDLRGKAWRKAASIVNKYGMINMSGLYGSIVVDEKDFVPWEK